MLNIFFDVDYTILAMDGSLRPGVHDLFQRLVGDGHRLYIWSGVGLRHREVRRHDLSPYVTDVFIKPQSEDGLRNVAYEIGVQPDFVVDDFPEPVSIFGGVLVLPYYSADALDQEMNRVYAALVETPNSGSG